MRTGVWVGLAAAVVLGSGTVVGWWAYADGRAESPPTGIVAASGRLEARTVRVSATTGGRLLRVGVEEGDAVEPRQVVAELDRRSQDAAAASASASVAAAEANVVAARRHIKALETQLALARLEAERYRRLYDRDAAPRQTAERADAALAQLESEVQAAQAGKSLAVRQVEAARAQARVAAVPVDEATIRAPIAGIVEEVVAREGEMLAPSAPLLVLRRTDETTVRVYVPIAEAQRIRPGAQAHAYVEAFPERVFSGTVSRVASEAEFTPKDVHMPDDRATLVFAVDIRFTNPDGALKDGFPADVYIRWDPSAPWPARAPWR